LGVSDHDFSCPSIQRGQWPILIIGTCGYFPGYVKLEGLTADGIVIATGSAPDGMNEAHPDGKVAVHEAGHWFGLMHTFEPYLDTEDGCQGEGDLVRPNLNNR
jgi:hypothetical protein